ncbi:ATPase [Legionella norrlandica]|uniref:tRNA threonylcarbamoyladenosine biosynthesis protein TsaE n=1 Tax=Legionella norrlandica TaxID=1498499 RepID=A0A0A2SV16_9GAMM|nr:tRNA (adenosine(37)-N6)-threonylcarbamoyltransferase complex ATPase subunit type 1 TsaE [Legionella norrlandica]KGP63274.1 ATPase [Legionella norrlandica]
MIIEDNDELIILDLANEEESKRFAEKLVFCIKAPLVITFSGEIGTGKTTIIRAMLRALGVVSAIKSPTFSLVESYACHEWHIHHFDLYRIHEEEELDYLGFRDYFSKQSICCIEWPEKAGKTLPSVDIRFNLNIKGSGRLMQMSALSGAGKKILACLAGE